MLFNDDPRIISCYWTAGGWKYEMLATVGSRILQRSIFSVAGVDEAAEIGVNDTVFVTPDETTDVLLNIRHWFIVAGAMSVRYAELTADIRNNYHIRVFHTLAEADSCPKFVG